jgi:hypothetical protein
MEWERCGKSMNQWTAGRVLITGVTGFLGANVMAKLVGLGSEMYGVAGTPQPQLSAPVLVGQRLPFKKVWRILFSGIRLSSFRRLGYRHSRDMRERGGAR